MNKHIKAIRKIVLDNQNKFDELGKKTDDLRKKYSEGNLAKNDYDNQLNEIMANNNSSTKVYNQIKEVEEKYHQDLTDWAMLKASDLTDDIKLFNSPIDFTAEDYKGLENKYQANYSMLKAIKDHATKNDVHYSSKFSIDKDEKAKAFNVVVDAAINITETTKIDKANYTGTLWGKEKAFNNLYKDTSRKIQTSEGYKKIIHGDGTISWE